MVSKIVLVASTGPMASSVVAALVEKFGYVLLPIRDYGLHESLVVKHKPNEIFVTGFRRVILAKCKPTRQGGVNVEDRGASPLSSKIDPNKVWPALDKIDQLEGIDLVDLYHKYRQAAATALTYKSVEFPIKGNVELTAGYHEMFAQDVELAYRETFDDVKVIFMHREFVSWAESIATQRAVNCTSPDKYGLLAA